MEASITANTIEQNTANPLRSDHHSGRSAFAVHQRSIA
jgi:hypothetical protein